MSMSNFHCKEVGTLNEVGSHEVIDIVLQAGYVTRKQRPTSEVIVYEAGGTRRGQYFYLMPNLKSSRYCYRYYFRKREA